MNAHVKTGCTIFYHQTLGINDRKVAVKQCSRFTPSYFLPGIEGVQLVWILVKIIPVILLA